MAGNTVVVQNIPVPLTKLISVAIAVLHQGIDLVDNVLTSDDQLTVHSKYVAGSTIGE
jgi:hypothetical protein